MKQIYKCIIYCFILLSVSLFSNRALAQYAIGGTAGNLVKQVYWLRWDATTLLSSPAGFSATNIVAGTYVWQYSPTARITAIVSNKTGVVESYTPGQYSGDGLDLIYSSNNLIKPNSRGVTNSGLVVKNGTAKFDLEVIVELFINNAWQPVDYPGMVIGDAESVDGQGEYFQATTPGIEAWHLLNKHINGASVPANDAYVMTLSDLGKTFKVRVKSGSGNLGVQAVMYAHKVKKLTNVEMKGSGNTAIALGFILPFDLGDAPASYGDKVSHYIDDFTYTKLAIGGDGIDFPVVNANESTIVPKAKVYIGSPNVDADGEGGHNTNADLDNTTQDNDEGTINPNALGDIKVNQNGDYVVGPFNVTNTKSVPATLYGWVDFNGDGVFSNDELITVTVPPNSTNYALTLTYPNATFINKIKVGPLYGRLRITTTSLTDDPATINIDERSIVAAGDGETEDYKFKDIIGVTVSGSIFNDGNGLTDGTISGTGIGILGSTQLYAYLVDDVTNNIVAKVSVNANGTYSFTKSVNKGNYTIAISTVSAAVGANISTIPATLPSGWTAVGEQFGTNNSQTGIETGTPDLRIKIVIPNTSLDITDLNFAVDQNPVAVNDSPSTATPINTSLVVPVLANDTDPNGNATINKTTVKLIDPADNTEKTTVTTTEGTYTVNATTGEVTFAPIATFIGVTGKTAATTIKYIVLDDAGVKSNQATLVIKVKPVGITDNSVTLVNVPVITTVKSNDGASGVGTTVAKVTDPLHGTIVVNADNTVTYTPNLNYVGPDSYNYKLVKDGVESDPITVNISIGLATSNIAGNVFNDTNGLNGLPLNTVDGSAYTLANLNVVAYNNATNKVEAISAVSALGIYSLSVKNGDNYTLYLTTNATTVGDAVAPAIALPAGWANTGENTSASAGSDGTPNSILLVGVVSVDKTNHNFGIEQIPTAAGIGANTANNPGGTTQITVPANTFTNSSVSADPTLVTGIRITAFPTNTTTIVINGTSYGVTDLAILTALIIPTDASGNPTQTITLDPVTSGNSVISFKAVDAAGKESTGTGTATLTIQNVPPTTDNIINPSIPTNQVTPVDINDPTGADTDGTVVSYRITSLTTTGTLYKADGITVVTLNEVLTVAEANGLKFKPAGNTHADVTFNIAAIDNEGLEDATPATFIIPLSNSTPVAVPNTNTVLEDNTLTVADNAPGIIGNILVNDTDGDNDPLVVSAYTVSGVAGVPVLGTAFTIPLVGDITINANGSYSFVPVLNYNGTVPVINYSISDGFGGTASSTLAITVTPVNDIPSFTKGADQALVIGAPAQTIPTWATALSKGPANESGQVLDFIVTNDKNTLFTTQPAIDENGNLTYTPAANQYGKTTVTVQVHDDGGTTNNGVDISATQTFLITIKPVGVTDTYNTTKNVPITNTVTSNDGASGIGTTVIAGGTNPTNGSIIINPDGTIKYTPNNNYVGPDSYTYILRTPDGIDSDPITVNISITNTTPIAIANTGNTNEDATLTVIDGATGVTGDILVHDSDFDNDPLTVSAYTYPGIIGTPVIGTPFTIPAVGSININANGSYEFIPLPDYNGSVPVFTYTISDGTATATSTLTITINPVNDIPSFTKGADQALVIGAPAQTIPTWATALSKGPANESGQVLDFIVTNDKNTLFTTQPAIAADGTLTYTPAPGKYGKTTVTVAVHDNGGTSNGGVDLSATQTFEITIKPVGVTDNDITPINTPVTTTVTNNDGASGIGTTVIPGGNSPLHGTIVINPDHTITYTPTPGYVGTDTYTYKLKTPDGVDSDPITVNINVYKATITLAKEGTYFDFDGNGRVNAGDRINYSFNVTNTGTVTLTNIKVTDPDAVIDPNLEIATLAVGGTATVTGYHILTQSDLDNGGVFNLATAKGKDPKGKDVTATSEDPTPLDPSDPNYPLNPPNNPPCPTCTVTEILQTGSMTLKKDGAYFDFNGDGKVNVGDRVNYTFAVTNTGNVTLTGITVNDNDAIMNAGGPIALAPGLTDNTTFKGYHVLTQSDLDNGGVFNLATAKGKDPKGKDVTATSEDPTPLDPSDPNYPLNPPNNPPCPTCTVTAIVQNGSMTLAKDGAYFDFNGDGKVTVGDRINYTFAVTNTGTVTLKNIKVTDPDAVIDPSLEIATLAVGGTATVTGYHVLTQSDLDNGGVFNLAMAKGKDPKGKDVTTTSTDPTPLDPSDPNYPLNPPNNPPCPTCTVTEIVQTGSMTLKKDGAYFDFNGDGKVNVGDRINYTFAVTNTGNVTLKNIKVTDPDAVIDPNLEIATLAVGGTATVTGYHILTQSDLDNGGVFNLATAKGKDPKGRDVTTTSEDPTPLDPSDPNYPVKPPVVPCPTCTVTEIVQNGSMTLAKDGAYFDFNGDGKVNVGDRVNYTFAVKNTGNVTLTSITVTDNNAIMNAGGPIALAPGLTDNTTFKGYHVLTQADLDNGGVFNLATAKGKDPKGKDVTTTSEDPTPLDPSNPNYPVKPPVVPCPTCTVTEIAQNGSMTLAKDGAYFDFNGDGKVNLGDRINYTFAVKNTGNVTLTGITVTDNNAIMNAGGPISLAPGLTDNTTFKGYHVLTQADLNNGGVFNLATAKGKDPKGKDVTTTSEDPTPLDPSDPNYPVKPPVVPCPTCTVTEIVQTGSMTLAKDGAYFDFNGDGKVNLGDRINYTFAVKNTGNVTLTGITVTDNDAIMNAGGPISLAPGLTDNTTFKGYHVLTQADLNNGGVFNLATAKGKDPKGKDVTTTSEDPTPLDPSDPNYPVKPPVVPCPTCTVTPIIQTGSIALIKTVTNTGTGVAGAFVLGNSIQYSFTITNTGNVNLNNISLVDTKLNTGAINIAGSLAPQASTTIIRNYIVTAADIMSGKVINTATVNATTPNNTSVKDVSGSTTTNDTPTVTNLGTPPTAKPDNATTLQNNSVKINIQQNDVAGSTPLLPGSVIITQQPLHGKVVVNPDGTVTYTPNDGYTGPDSFTYTVKDANGQTSNPALVSITVVPSSPKATDDKAKTLFGTPVTIPILTNDTKDVAPFDLKTIEIVNQPLHGTVRVNSDGTIVYTPNDGYTGIETFTYRLKDAYGNYTNVATVTISVEGTFFGNIITPDGDGKNDTWVIVGANSYDRVEVEFFNRWGNQVYISKNYKNDWSGENLNGGTYYYIAKLYKGDTYTNYKGWVLIKRK